MEEKINTPEFIGGWLEYHGWTRAVAGDTDFNAAVNAILAMRRTEHHGLYVTGDYGCGKTALIRTILNGRCPFWVNLATTNVAEKFTDEWQLNNSVDPFCGHVFLDDLGAEKMVNDYGVKVDLAGEFILRYHLCGRGRLFITTNLNAKQFDARYGGRVRSRLRDLCVPLKLTGTDKREWITNVKC